MTLASLLFLAATLIDRTPAIAPMFEARAALGQRDFATATAKMQTALAAVPNDPALLFTYAQIQMRAGDPAGAMETLGKVAALGAGFHPDADPAFKELEKQPGYDKLLAKFAEGLPVVERGKPAFTLAERDLRPEGIACDTRSGTLYVSSVRKKKIVRVTPNGQTKDLVTEGQDGLLGVLGMKLDRTEKTIWVAGSDEESAHSGLFRFDLKTGKLVEKQMLPETERHLLNDLDVAPNGDVYATDTFAGTVYRFHDGQREEFFKNLPGANGIAFSGDGTRLYVASSGRGIAVIDMKTKALTIVRVPEKAATVGVDGLYWYKDSLIAIQNVLGRDRVMRYFLSDPTSIARAEIIDSQHPLFDEPTTGAICRGAFYYFANTQLGRTDLAALKPIVILKTPLAAR
ncbi:MAG TPA: SMP-30/gluconolactonase/LRE family protein [Thermoanaerobaculia bacterium]|nr:SMP-30/gluconolactonase/LRE family protein [Thermoanaerobaculia bacterium]